MAEEEKKAKEDTQAQQKLLKKTKDGLLDTRKAMTKSFASMNNIINKVSMLKNLKEFEECVNTYLDKNDAFVTALQAHLENLNQVNENTPVNDE